jgi:hypothetical protein
LSGPVASSFETPRKVRGSSKLVMAGLVPAIHVFLARCSQDVDARHKAGHDEKSISRTGIIPDSDDGAENTPAARCALHILWAKDFPAN